RGQSRGGTSGGGCGQVDPRWRLGRHHWPRDRARDAWWSSKKIGEKLSSPAEHRASDAKGRGPRWNDRADSVRLGSLPSARESRASPGMTLYFLISNAAAWSSNIVFISTISPRSIIFNASPS